MRKTSVYLSEPQKRRLTALAAASGVSEAQLIREALDARLSPEAGPALTPDLPVPGRRDDVLAAARALVNRR